MSRRNWQKIAQEQFEKMTTEYQDDWRDFRNRVM